MASVLSFLTPNKSAEAVGNFRDTINVDNILLENYETNSKKFNGHQLDKLYSLITGVKNATYEDVLGAVKSPKTSEYYKTKNGKDIIKDEFVGYYYQRKPFLELALDIINSLADILNRFIK